MLEIAIAKAKLGLTTGDIDSLRENGVTIIDLDSAECKQLRGDYIAANTEIWNEDIGK